MEIEKWLNRALVLNIELQTTFTSKEMRQTELYDGIKSDRDKIQEQIIEFLKVQDLDPTEIMVLYVRNVEYASWEEVARYLHMTKFQVEEIYKAAIAKLQSKQPPEDDRINYVIGDIIVPQKMLQNHIDKIRAVIPVIKTLSKPNTYTVVQPNHCSAYMVIADTIGGTVSFVINCGCKNKEELANIL